MTQYVDSPAADADGAAVPSDNMACYVLSAEVACTTSVAYRLRTDRGNHYACAQHLNRVMAKLQQEGLDPALEPLNLAPATFML